MMATVTKPDGLYFPILAGLVECLREQLLESSDAVPCTISLVGGSAPPSALMTCRDGKGCGVAWVRPVGVAPALQDYGSGAQQCATPVAMTFEIGVARCYPRFQGREATLDPQDTFEAMELIMSDMQAMRRAALCCDVLGKAGIPRHQAPKITLSNWTPLEAAAGIGGGTWQGVIS